MTAPEARDGVLLIDKPPGITSHDAVGKVRRALGIKRVGHAGTLDPMATGLLVMGVGRGTRLLRFLRDLPKVYEGAFRLGVETDTLDVDGQVVRAAVAPNVTEEAVREAMRAKVGGSLQTPPAFSAVKAGGRKLYEAARKGETIEVPPRPVTVYRFELTWMGGADVGFLAEVSGGTYIRVLAADVGAALGCGAHLIRLRRTSVGSLSVDDARSPDDPGVPLPLETAVGHLPQVVVDEEEAVAVSHGRILGPSGTPGPHAVLDRAGKLLGIYQDEGSKARPVVILAPAGG